MWVERTTKKVITTTIVVNYDEAREMRRKLDDFLGTLAVRGDTLEMTFTYEMRVIEEEDDD